MAGMVWMMDLLDYRPALTGEPRAQRQREMVQVRSTSTSAHIPRTRIHVASSGPAQITRRTPGISEYAFPSPIL